MYRHFVDVLEQHTLRCPVKALLHIDCPGCGFQRSVIALLRGHLADSWHIYPPGIFILSLIFLLCLHLVFHFKYGAELLKYFYTITSIVVLINYFYKIITHQL